MPIDLGEDLRAAFFIGASQLRVELLDRHDVLALGREVQRAEVIGALNNMCSR